MLISDKLLTKYVNILTYALGLVHVNSSASESIWNACFSMERFNRSSCLEFGTALI